MIQFEKTYQSFKEVLDIYPCDYSTFRGWYCIPRELKAIALYVNFYDQITLAWSKTRKYFVLEEDGVSTILQYLEKNVDVILENPKRFTPAYIYTITKNCVYCLGRIQRDIDFYTNSVSYYECDRDFELEWTERYNEDHSCGYTDRTGRYVDLLEVIRDRAILESIVNSDDMVKEYIVRKISGKSIPKRIRTKEATIVRIIATIIAESEI